MISITTWGLAVGSPQATPGSWWWFATSCEAAASNCLAREACQRGKTIVLRGINRPQTMLVVAPKSVPTLTQCLLLLLTLATNNKIISPSLLPNLLRLERGLNTTTTTTNGSVAMGAQAPIETTSSPAPPVKTPVTLEPALLAPGFKCGTVPIYEKLYRRSINESLEPTEGDGSGKFRILHGLDSVT